MAMVISCRSKAVICAFVLLILLCVVLLVGATKGWFLLKKGGLDNDEHVAARTQALDEDGFSNYANGLPRIPPDKANFGKYKGEKGERGAKGDRGEGIQGPPGRVGDVGRAGPKGDKGSCEYMGVDAAEAQLDGLTAESSCNCNATNILEMLKNDSLLEKLRGPPGAPGFPGPAGMTGTNGDRGFPGDKGKKGEPTGTSSLLSGQVKNVSSCTCSAYNTEQLQNLTKGSKGERGPRGRKGPIGPPGSVTSYPAMKMDAGLKGQKGESVVSAGIKGEKGQKGIDGRDGLPGLPSAENSGYVAVPGPPGPPGPPGARGMPGTYLDAYEQEKFGNLHNFVKADIEYPHENFGFNANTRRSTTTISFQSTDAMLKSQSPVGTIAYIIEEEALLVRVNSGWQYIALGSLLPLATQAPSTTTVTPSPGPDFLASNLVNVIQKPLDALLYTTPEYESLRIAALNEPYTGDLQGIRGADFACHRQARRAGLSTSFRAFLASRIQNLDGIIRLEDRNLPVVNTRGDVLFNTWNSIFNGQGGFFSQIPRIYSFNGKNVLTDSNWPKKIVWHGSKINGERAIDNYCDAWHGNTKMGLGSSLLGNKLLDQGSYPCDSRFVVLCIEAVSHETRRKRMA